jgi:glutamate 5-kinase
VKAVIANADRIDVLSEAVAGVPGVGTVVVPRRRRLPARKLWIAFAVGSAGTIYVDAGARRALTERGVSLLPAGVTGAKGAFPAGEAVEIADPDGQVFAKGITRLDAAGLREVAGLQTGDLPDGLPHEVVHRDDLVLL